MTDNNARQESGTCHVCKKEVPVDGEQAIRRFGNVLCRECSGEPVVFKVECSSGLCGWETTVDGDEFNRGHLKTRAQQEANRHQRGKEVFDDNPMHRTSITEVE